MKTKITISADVKVSDETLKNAKKQYPGIKTKEEVAENMLRIAALNGVEDISNSLGYCWSGVCHLRGLITNIEEADDIENGLKQAGSNGLRGGCY